MAITVKTDWNFECVNCPKYVKPNKKGYMGFCPINDKKVKKDNTCNKNPILTRFWFWIHGISLEKISPISDEDLVDLKAKVLKEVYGSA